MSAKQVARADAGLCRHCGKPLDRRPIKGNRRPVSCCACLKAIAAKTAARMAGHAPAVAEMRRQLGLPPQEEA